MLNWTRFTSYQN